MAPARCWRKRTDDGRQRLVRHGHLPERQIMTGIGPVAVCVPRVRDRLGDGALGFYQSLNKVSEDAAVSRSSCVPPLINLNHPLEEEGCLNASKAVDRVKGYRSQISVSSNRS